MALRKGSETTRLRRAQAAAAAIERHRRALVKARARLGDLTMPGDPDVFLGEDWTWARQLRHHTARLRTAYGLVGVGLGVRRRNGTAVSEPCIVAYVKKKHPPEKLKAKGWKPVPSTMTIQGRRIPVDVVEFGGLELQSSVGGSVGPTGKPSIQGTLGAFATDRQTQKLVAITAMHVAGQNSVSEDSPISFYDYSSDTELGEAVLGTRDGIDAVKIALRDGLPRLLLSGFEPIRRWRALQFPGDAGISVWLHGAKSGTEGGILVGNSTSIPRLEEALVVKIRTQPGDSGAALIDNDHNLLGFLVGRNTSDDTRVFCPASRVLEVLRCDIRE